MSNRSLDKFKADALILVLGKNGDLPETLPESTRDQLTRFIKAGDFDGSKGQMCWLHQPEGLAAARLLLVGRGDKQLSDQQWQDLLRNTVKAVSKAPVKHALWLLDGDLPKSLEWQAREGTRVAEESTYRFDQYRSKPAPASKLNKWTFWHAEKDAALSKASKIGKGVADGVNLARDLG
ncbi:M17 family peptidase N-terminal domain-containing protein, partial [Alcanivorax sp.]|uniref:M17 family peptidase N-terminal domain-containing protein n=1 Tax=Alcanivorax sp. TaxID=1872427 RepID=UPI003DA73B11